MAEKLIKVEIVRDTWDADGVRHRAGTVTEVPVDAAIEGIESGALKSVKEPKKA